MTRIPTATTIHVAMNGTITLRSSQFGIHAGNNWGFFPLGAMVAVLRMDKENRRKIILRTFLLGILATQDANHNNCNNQN